MPLNESQSEAEESCSSPRTRATSAARCESSLETLSANGTACEADAAAMPRFGKTSRFQNVSAPLLSPGRQNGSPLKVVPVVHACGRDA